MHKCNAIYCCKRNYQHKTKLVHAYKILAWLVMVMVYAA